MAKKKPKLAVKVPLRSKEGSAPEIEALS